MPKKTAEISPRRPAVIVSLARACRLAEVDYRTLCKAMLAGHFTPDHVTLGEEGRAYVNFDPQRLFDIADAVKRLKEQP
mgnify:CR=1 FL=1|jgi:hypothetical protein